MTEGLSLGLEADAAEVEAVERRRSAMEASTQSLRSPDFDMDEWQKAIEEERARQALTRIESLAEEIGSLVSDLSGVRHLAQRGVLMYRGLIDDLSMLRREMEGV